VRITICAIFCLGICDAQALKFEVAAIHRTDPKEFSTPSGCTTTPGLMRCSNVTLKRCIVGAYAIGGADRVVGGPDWINNDRFQITGKSDQPVGDRPLMAMLQTLLAARFKLVLHRESRRGETMVLGISKKGPKLHPAVDAPYGWKNMHDHIEATKLTMSEFAEILSRNLNVPVVDRTGLTGAFSFALRWDPNVTDGLNHEESAVAVRPEVSRAITQQLGLTLKSRKMPIEVLVVDHAERPLESEN